MIDYRVPLLLLSVLCAFSKLPVRAETQPGIPVDTSLAEAIEKARHAIRSVHEMPAHRWAQNPGNGLNARFTPEGLAMTVRVTAADGTFRNFSTNWETKAYGYGREVFPVPSGTVCDGLQNGESDRVEIVRAGLVEWFVNNSSGLEHGWTLSKRPAGSERGDPLRVEMELEGDLHADVSPDGGEVILRDTEGKEALRYKKLKVWDAKNREVAARMVGGGKFIAVEVEDSNAVYPLTIDPIFAQQAYLKASNPGAGDGFGRSVAISGNTAVVGAIGEGSSASGVGGNQNDNSAANAGAVYVFVRNGNTWIQEAYLKASNAGAGDWFGYSVAIEGNTIVVGAPREDSNATSIGGNEASNSAQDSGAAYVFVRNGSSWTQQAYLKASNSEAGDDFGTGVAISGNTIIVGAPHEDGSSSGVNQNQASNGLSASGAGYVFVRSGTAWAQQAYLKASLSKAGNNFAWSVAISGNTAVVGAPFEDSGDPNNQNDSSATDAGAAYVFIRTGTTWSQQLYLKAANAGAGDTFGVSVDISGETIVVGAPLEDGPPFGSSTSGDVAQSGAAYVFTRSGTEWNSQTYLKATYAGVSDEFGASVAISGNIVVVGALGESSAATGAGGDQSSDSASKSGAAYVFVRSDSLWYDDAYLKASNTGADDWFGYSIAIDGNIGIVGALQEDSIGNNQNDNSAASAGAAYIFDILPFPEGYMTIPKRFSSTQVGRKGRSQTVRIVNTGSSPFSNMRVSTIGRAKRDFVVTQPIQRTIAPGASTAFKTTFKPSAKGSRRAILQLRGVDLAITAPLSGTGKVK